MAWLKKFTTYPMHLLWILLAYLPFLGSMSIPLTGDQKTYLSTALEMRERGSWLIPYLFGEPSYYKPPFQYWMSMLGWKIFGLGLWGALIPSVLASLLTAWLLAEIVILLGASKRENYTGLWFAAAIGTMGYGTTAQMEIYLCLFYALAWFCALKFLLAPRNERRDFWLLSAFAVAGLSSIVKSPLYWVLWLMSFGSYLVVKGEWKLVKERRFYLACGVSLLFAGAWYGALLALDPHRFFSDYLMRETWAKNSGNGGTVLSLWGAWGYFSLPFVVLSFAGAKRLFHDRKLESSIYTFLICWAWPIAVFFSLYPYRIKPYFYLLVPVSAILADFGKTRWAIRATSGLIGVALILIASIGFWTELLPFGLNFGFIVLAVVAIILGFLRSTRGLSFLSLGIILLVRVSAVNLGESDLAGLRAAVLESPQARFAMLDLEKNIWHEAGLLSLAVQRPIQRLYSLEAATEFLNQGGVVILTDLQSKDSIAQLGFTPAQLVTQSWRRFKMRRQMKDWKADLYREFTLARLSESSKL
jgi:4-amino-4-deoxy-L-arabinose transferase-like glycosyltransferase